jgi:circadian clock protein KaiC
VAVANEIPNSLGTLPKTPTGIDGLDEVTGGGLPKGRPTLICGSAGCGKTLLAMEFLVRGAAQFNEPGVFMAFEETAPELAQNVRSLGFDLDQLAAEKKVILDHVHVERGEIEENGEYDLEGIFIRLGFAIDSIGAKRVVLDTIETLFAGLDNQAILRSELRRLFRWLKDKGVTAVITGERGDGALTRQGLEEYVSDCVILLDHRIIDQISTRRLRVVKYRGSVHGTNEYPFLIGASGISVLPITSLGLNHTVSSERVSTGVAGLDAMLGGSGYYRGSSVLATGTAGAGKTSLAAHFAAATCERGERCLYFASEESKDQMVRNMRSIGIDLGIWIDCGLLSFHASRPTFSGLETHLAIVHKQVAEFKPRAVIVDPISNLVSAGSLGDAQSMVLRLVDFLKDQQITLLMTSLTSGGQALEQTELGISSLIDTWLLMRDLEANGERNRVFYVLKSRGMHHSNQLREFRITARGIELIDAYVGPGGVLTGSSRVAQEARERAAALVRAQEIEQKERELLRKRTAVEAQIAAILAAFDAETEELKQTLRQHRASEAQLATDQDQIFVSRSAAGDGSRNPNPIPAGTSQAGSSAKSAPSRGARKPSVEESRP